MAAFVGGRKYMSMVNTMDILEGHGHQQEASAVASGRRKSQGRTGDLKCMAATSSLL